jgi:Zn-dependent M28 family amino/carboxypeptidase
VAAQLGLKVSPDQMPEQAMFIRSDQFPFVQAGVPSVFMSEGFAAKDKSLDVKKVVETWIATRYHAPSDDLKQPLNFDAALQFTRFHFLVGYTVAQDEKRPTWNKGDFFGERAAKAH